MPSPAPHRRAAAAAAPAWPGLASVDRASICLALTGFALLAILTLLAGCTPAEREGQCASLDRWQDRRLAPPDSLHALLTGPDAVVRRAAVRAAGLIGRTDVLAAMIAALDDPSRSVRCEAAFSLGLLGGDVAVAPLTELLADRDPLVREAAAAGLAHQEHDGAMLLPLTLDDEPRVAGAAWTALRNVASRASGDSLTAAIRAGLSHPESAVRWRVLRCAEMVPDSTLVAQIAPFAIDRDVQVRVHALRALGRNEGEEALAAVLRSSDRRQRLRSRELQRIQVAELRALGNLAGPTLAAARELEHASLAGRTASLLQQSAAAVDAAVAQTALEAMTVAVKAVPLPAEAARQESLLPVWRLRLVRAARERLDDPGRAIRAAAVGALGALRGRGAVDELTAVLDDPDPTVAGAALAALLRLVPDHDLVCDWTAQLSEQHGTAGEIAVLGALPDLLAALREAELMQAPVTRFPRRRDPGCLPSLAWWLAARGLGDSDFVVRALAAPLLAELPGPSSRSLISAAWQAEQAHGRVEVQLALLRALQELHGPAAADRPEFEPRRQECLFFAMPHADQTELAGAGNAPEPAESALILTGAFDHADLRVRLAARQAALVTGLLPDDLIPTAASLRETQPAHRRHPAQPLPTDTDATTRVRLITERGEAEIRLDPDTAPWAVASFLGLIEQGFHDDLTFHRVVPDFVVQGGCPRGDGWGGPPWTLRSEWSRRPFERGTVGVAHAGKDTGGSQWFVCLSPQPHLDGRYTVFGEVTSGLEVLDRIQRGDRYRLVVVPH